MLIAQGSCYPNCRDDKVQAWKRLSNIPQTWSAHTKAWGLSNYSSVFPSSQQSQLKDSTKNEKFSILPPPISVAVSETVPNI